MAFKAFAGIERDKLELIAGDETAIDPAWVAADRSRRERAPFPTGAPARPKGGDDASYSTGPSHVQ